MYKDLIEALKNPPLPYEDTGFAFWDDEYISKSMLNAHLTPETDGASRRHVFIEKSAAWIKTIAPGVNLLDLGCGPGIYAEKLAAKGFNVTGIDFSKRSINYAKKSALEKNIEIKYYYKNYLDIDYKEEFDTVILIYCDFGVLKPADRTSLVKKIYKALKPGGILVMDTFSQYQYRDFKNGIRTKYEDKGFWSAEPYICIQNSLIYPDSNDYLEQYVIITEKVMRDYNLWNHAFSAEELKKDFISAGFGKVVFYGDASGSVPADDSKTLCAVCTK